RRAASLSLPMRDVGKSLRDRVDLLRRSEEEGGRVPGAGQERSPRPVRNRARVRDVASPHGPRFEVERHLDRRIGLDRFLERLDLASFERDARHAERDAVPEEDLGERLADDAANPPAKEALRRMLARRAASEVRVDDEDARALELRPIERMRAAGRALAVVGERVLPETSEGHGTKEASREDALGADVVAADGHRTTADGGDLADRAHTPTGSS